MHVILSHMRINLHERLLRARPRYYHVKGTFFFLISMLHMLTYIYMHPYLVDYPSSYFFFVPQIFYFLECSELSHDHDLGKRTLKTR